MCFCTDPIRPQVADTIQNGIPPNVSAVTNTRGPGKQREGALSLEQITFKPQRGVRAAAQVRPFVLSTTGAEQLGWNRGGGVTLPLRLTCLRTWSCAGGLITHG